MARRPAEARTDRASRVGLYGGAEMKVGNDKSFLIKIISQCLPYIGYPRSLNVLRCVNEAAKGM